MFWKPLFISLFAAAIAGALIRLGSLSVWVSVLSFALKVGVGVAVIIAIAGGTLALAAWRRRKV